MDATMITLGIIIGIGFGLTLSQWSIWRYRAVTAANHAEKLQSQIDNITRQFEHIANERLLHHETMQHVFDFIDDNGPWGSNDVIMGELRMHLMNVLKDSSVGRV